jgi:hypothetical protein
MPYTNQHVETNIHIFRPEQNGNLQLPANYKFLKQVNSIGQYISL